MKYFISIKQEDLLEGNESLTYVGSQIVPVKESTLRLQGKIGEPPSISQPFSIHAGIGNDSRLYYYCDGTQLKKSIDKLLECTKDGSEIIVKEGIRENFPSNLNQAYQEFFDKIKK